MTDVIPDMSMRFFTPEAQQRFDDYLNRVRAALAGCPEVSLEDIEQDIRAHIAAELPPGARPVTLAEIQSVLARLGQPEQWVSGEAPPAWRTWLGWLKGRPAVARQRFLRAAERVRHGPEDWRLAYVTLGLLVTGVIIFPLAIVLVPASYFVARAAVALARERGESLGPKRWLIYPPLVLFSVPVLLGLLFWPIAPAAEAAEGLWRANRADIRELLGLTRDLSEFLTYVYVITGVMGVWWLILGTLSWVFPGLPAAVFCPLISTTSRRRGGLMVLISGCVLAVWVSATVQLLPVQDWWSNVKQSLREDRPEPPPRRPSGGRNVVAEPRAVVSQPLLERQVRAVVTDFLRLCRNQNSHQALEYTGVPFYNGGGGTAATPLAPEILTVIRDGPGVLALLTDQLRRMKPGQAPSEVLGMVTYRSYRTTIADDQTRADLDEVLTPDDWVVAVGRDGRDLGRVLVKLQNERFQVVGLMN